MKSSLLSPILVWMLLAMAGLARAFSPNPDLTAAGAIDALKVDANSSPLYTETYNLGPTGLRGWIYIGGGNGADGTITVQSRQILVTVASAPGNAVLAVDDVILGAMAGSSGTVPLFTSDARKAFGAAITESEKTGVGSLRVKRWRAGVTTDVNIPMTIMGDYTATAPYSCPKSALILANARDSLVSQLLANSNFLTNDWSGAINGLALLAGVAPGDPNYATVQTRLQTYARGLAATSPNFAAVSTWSWGYIGLFLSEYYLSTGDANVVTGMNNYIVALAKVQSRYGTYGHAGSLRNADGSFHGTVGPYGPVNQAGLPAVIAIVLGKKALQAAGVSLDPEIDPAIQRGSDFFAWFVNKGPIPYGEHEPFMDGHSSNGKDPLCAVLFGLQAARTVETEYFARMSVAGFIGREYGHTGQGFSYLWGAMGAHMGGALALAEYLKPIRWHLDLERRTDGSFVYDGAEQYGAGKTSNGTYLGTSGYYSMNPTATYILTYGLPLQRIYITGKNATPANTLDATKVSNAVAAATFNLDAAGLTTTQLIAAVSEFDPVVRNYAAIELAKRTLTAAEVNTLLAMLTGASANGRMGACQVLGLLKNATALPLITQRLYDSDLWVRAKAASALRSYDAATASTQRDAMLAAFAANATNPDVIDWSDPIQICNGYLGFALFGDAVYGGTNIATYTINAPKNLLYPALKVGLKQPDSKARFGPAKFCNDRLTLADVQALIPDLVEVIETESQADTMWSMNPRGSGIATLAKYKIREGIPLALAMQDIPDGFGWNASGFQVPGLNALVAYGDASRWTLPTLRSYLGTWDPLSSQYTTLVNSIASIDNAITAPAQALGFAVATSQVVATTGARSITLSGASPRTAVTFGNVTAPLHGTLSGTAPNLTYTPNAGYTGPDFFTFQVMDDLTTSEPGTVSIIVGTAGTGLKGEYFDNVDFTNLKLTRTDAQVNFDWGTGSPDASIGADTFSVRWSGLLLVPETASYTFSTLNSDGVRLYINGALVIDDYTDQTTNWKDGTPVNLTAGQMVDVQIEYYENTGSAVAKLKWTGPSFAGANGLPIATEWLFDGSGVTNRTAYAHDQSVTMIQNTSQPVTLTGSGGTLTYSIVTPPANGTLSGTAPNLTYTPTTNFNGTDSFTFLVNNGTANSTPATVSIAIWAGTPVDYFWATAASANWSGATTWNNAAGATSVPNASGQPFYRMSVSKTGTYTATQDVSGGFVLNQLNVAGTVTLAGTNSFNFTANGPILPQFNQNSASAVTISAPLTLNAMTTFGGTSGGNVTISGVISGAGGFTKSNAGTLTLSNFTNTYTGGTVLNAGEVAFPAGSGTATPHFGTGPITVNSEATLHTNRSTFNNSITLNSATVVTGNSFESLLAGPVTLNGITTFSFGTTGGFRITGNISGTGGFTTTGTTQWTLTGTNSYTGPTTIQAGTLRYSAAAAVGPGAISIATGGKANLNYTGTRSIASLTLGGVLQAAGTYGSNASSAANKSDTFFTSTGVGVLNVLLIPTTTAVTSNLTPAMTGSAVTFTATVTGGTPTGNVTFFDGPTAIGTSTLNANFQATLTRSTLTAGTHTITAQYLGDPSHAASTSAGVSQVIVLSPFDSWATSQSLTLGVNAGPLDDPNHDGLCNLLAFALGASPTTSSIAALPKLTRTGNTWTFEYDRSDLSLGVTTQVVEYGSDLVGWTPITIPANTSGSVTITPGTPSDHVTVTIPMSGGSCFVRLKVMQ